MNKITKRFQLDDDSDHFNRTFNDFYRIGLVCYIFGAYISSQYFNRDTWANITSYFSNEPPWGLEEGCLPEPIGVHYFGDLVTTACHSLERNPYLVDSGTNYFPFAYWLARPFGELLRYGLMAPVLLFVSIFFFVGYVVFLMCPTSMSPKQKAMRTFLIVACSSPGIAVVDRGNLQLLVSLTTLLWLYFLKKNQTLFGAVALGVATALKGFPIVFALAFVKTRDWRALRVYILTLVILTTVPILMYPGNVLENIQIAKSGIFGFRRYGDWGLRYNSSLRALVLTLRESQFTFGFVTEFLIQNYSVVVLVFAIIIIGLVLDPRISTLEFCILGAVFSCLLLDNVAPYALTVFWLPLCINESHQSQTVHRALGFLVAILLVPKGFVIGSLGEPPSGAELGPVSLISFVNPVVMLLIFIILLFKSSLVSKIWERPPGS